MLNVGLRFGVLVSFAKRLLESLRLMRQKSFFVNSNSEVRIDLTNLLKTFTISNESCEQSLRFLNRFIPYQFRIYWLHRLAGSSMVDSTVGFITIIPVLVIVEVFFSSLCIPSSTLLTDVIE